MLSGKIFLYLYLFISTIIADFYGKSDKYYNIYCRFHFHFNIITYLNNIINFYRNL